MKVIKRLLFWILMIPAVLWAVLLFSGNGHILVGLHSTYFVGKSKPDIDDLEFSKYRRIEKGEMKPWVVKENTLGIHPLLQKSVDSMATTAFLVIHKDSIVYENYWDGFHADSVSNTFSATKSMTSLLYGVAERKGLIQLSDPLSKFLPEFGEGMSADLKIEDLLEMSSGVVFGESYASPFGYQAKAYYGSDLENLTREFRVTKTPGTNWLYEGGTTVLLGLALQEAFDTNLSYVFQEEIWKKIGVENDAYWAVDGSGKTEKYFSAFYTTPRDFAKVGKMLLDSSMVDGEKILSSNYLETAFEPCFIDNELGDKVYYYGHHWWLGEYSSKKMLLARGIRGQYLILFPEDDLIIVRFGRKRSKEKSNYMPVDLFDYIEVAYDYIVEQ